MFEAIYYFRQQYFSPLPVQIPSGCLQQPAIQ